MLPTLLLTQPSYTPYHPPSQGLATCTWRASEEYIGADFDLPQESIEEMQNKEPKARREGETFGSERATYRP